MFNRVVLVGNLTRDIELRYTTAGAAIGNSAIAVTRKFNVNGEKREETCFIDIDFFGRTAEIANQYLRKGSKILIEGRLKLDQWQDQNGQNRSKHSISVDTMEMLGSNQGGSGGYNQGGNYEGGNYGGNSGGYGGGNSSYSNYGGGNRRRAGWAPTPCGRVGGGNSYANRQNSNSRGAKNDYNAPKQKEQSYESTIPEVDVDADKYDDGNDTIPF